MWPSLETASRVSDFANAALVCSLVVGVVATWLIVWMGNVKEAYWESDRQQSRERVVGLESGVADANARAAEANRKAEEERLARIKIEERIAPRRLSTEQLKLLTAIFINFPGRTVRVSSYELDVDGAMLGMQLLSAARGAALPVDPKLLSQGAIGGMTIGISVTGTDAALVTATIEALGSFGLHPTPDPPPPTAGMSFGGQGVPLPLKIFVGVKPLAE